MTKPQPEIAQLKADAENKLAAVTNADQLEAWRVEYIGRKGAIPNLLRGIKDLPEGERKEAGAQGNKLQHELKEAYDLKERSIKGEGSQKTVDPKTADDALRFTKGHLHPITLATRRIEQILIALGFDIVSGPEVEQEYYDFDALNIPLTHPARAESDSFYIDPRKTDGSGLVLRTSTSAVQVRSVIEHDLAPPFKIASPGRVFRNEKLDPTHESMFHQIEALVVGPDVTIADYKGVTETLFSTFFGSKTTIRLRPGYFPFVEPGFEVDMSCVFCSDGCRICKGARWIEMGGAGMVHPNVLKNMNIDPDKYTGFAFGYGIDRFTMLRHEINDIRLFWSGNIRFLRQFS